MVIITAFIKAKTGKEGELKSYLQTMTKQVTGKEPDCLQYTLHQGLESKTSFFIYERYKNKEAVDVHTSTKHFKELMSNIEGLVAAPAQIELFEVTE